MLRIVGVDIFQERNLVKVGREVEKREWEPELLLVGKGEGEA